MTWDASRYRKPWPAPPVRLVELNAWIAQERETRDLMARLVLFAASIGCTVDTAGGIHATNEQVESIERWWLANAPPAKAKP